MSLSGQNASSSEGKEILRILESSAAKGNIELIYTRRPDAYESYMKEPTEARVFVSKVNDRAVGTCAELIRRVYIGGEACNCAYICGLKKDAEYKGNIGFGVRFIHGLYREDIDYYFCSVVAENSEAQQMFEKGKRLISVKPMTEFRTYIINPKVKVKSPKHDLNFCRAKEKDKDELIEFLNNEGRRKDLFPVIESFEDFYGLSCESFYMLKKDGRIVAAAALWNQTEYKQYLVKRYGGIMKLARVFNPLLSFLGYIKLPRENEALNFPMLSFFLCEDDREDYYRIFLNEIKKEISKEYGIFVIGLPRSHVAAPIFDSLPSIKFDTKLNEISFPWSSKKCKSANRNNLFPECGLL